MHQKFKKGNLHKRNAAIDDNELYPTCNWFACLVQQRLYFYLEKKS